MKKIFAFVALASFISLGVSNTVVAASSSEKSLTVKTAGEGDGKKADKKKDEVCEKKSCCSAKAKAHCGAKGAKAEAKAEGEHAATELKEVKAQATPKVQ